MGDVVGINGARPAQVGEPKADVIGVLENLLERARSGQVQSFIGTGFCSDGCRITVFSGDHENIYEMLGALSWLEHEYVHRNTDARK